MRVQARHRRNAPGRDLLSLVDDARTVRGILRNLHSRYNRKVVEQAAIAGVLEPGDHRRHRDGQCRRGIYRRRLDTLADEVERGWVGHFTEGEGFRSSAPSAASRKPPSSTTPCSARSMPRKLDEYAASCRTPIRAGVLRRKDTEP